MRYAIKYVKQRRDDGAQAIYGYVIDTLNISAIGLVGFGRTSTTGKRVFKSFYSRSPDELGRQVASWIREMAPERRDRRMAIFEEEDRMFETFADLTMEERALFMDGNRNMLMTLDPNMAEIYVSDPDSIRQPSTLPVEPSFKNHPHFGRF